LDERVAGRTVQRIVEVSNAKDVSDGHDKAKASIKDGGGDHGAWYDLGSITNFLGCERVSLSSKPQITTYPCEFQHQDQQRRRWARSGQWSWQREHYPIHHRPGK